MFDRNYIDACRAGEASLDAIDVYIEYWHTHETNRTLQEFLGMTPCEYAQWIRAGEDIILKNIITSRGECAGGRRSENQGSNWEDEIRCESPEKERVSAQGENGFILQMGNAAPAREPAPELDIEMKL